MCAQTSRARSHKANKENFRFFLEAIAEHLRVPYFSFFLSVTLIIELVRIIVDYVTVVEQARLSVDYLIALWVGNWLVFLWPVCLALMYYSMRYLRKYTLETMGKINPRLKEPPTYVLAKVFQGKSQHILPLCFLGICIFYFARMWVSDGSLTFYSTNALRFPVQEIPLKFIHSAFWITYNWIIGGYFSWICISTVIVAYASSTLVDNVDVFHYDRCGGLSAVGSLAMRTAVLYIFSVSFMFPGWIVWGGMTYPSDRIDLGLQFGAITSLVIMELALFLLPMVFFHSRMSSEKNSQLRSFDVYIMDFRDRLAKNLTTDEYSRRFENTMTLQGIARTMNEYPFNYGMLARVTASAAISYLAAIGQSVIEYLSKQH